MIADKQRVVVWSTGGIGSIAIRAITQRPNLDLVGVWVHSPDKDGKDAGELANGEPIGLAATSDADALIALKPDCVVYAASGPERDALAIPDYVKLLNAGINVVTTSTTRWSTHTPTSPRNGGTNWSPPPKRGRPRCTRRASNPVSPQTICRWSCPRSRRGSRRSTPMRWVCTTTTGCPTS